MKRILHLTLLSIIIFLFGCNTSEKDFNKAMEFYSVQSFENFLQEHPEGNWSDSAKMHIAFIFADSIGESNKYDEFLKQYPMSSLSKRVKILFDSLTTINGGCLTESQQLPSEVKSELDSIMEKKSLKSLSEFLLKDSSNYKETARPKIQEIMNVAIAFKRVGSSSFDSLQSIYSPDTSSSKFSYELSLIKQLDWQRIETEKEVAVSNHYYKSQTSILENFASVLGGIYDKGGTLSNSSGMAEFDSKFNETSSRITNSNVRKMKSIISSHNKLLKDNILTTIQALINLPSDVCAKEQYWKHLNSHLQNGKNGIYLEVQSSSLYSGYESFSDEEKEKITESLNALYQREKHDMIKKVAGELIEKLNK